MDKSALLADRVSDKIAEVEIEGVGTVTVRALSRFEMIQGGKLADDPMAQERFILSRAMVDPQMGEHDVAAWQKSSIPGEINKVATVVNQLSGIGQGADKSSV
jgi:hypothetical protein